MIGPNAVLWLDETGSGNETAAHLLADGRLTVMFCACEGAPMILRFHGRGRVIGRGSPDWAALPAVECAGAEPPGARQMIWLDVDLVQISCGFAVPVFDHAGPRDTLDRRAASKSDAELDAHRRGEHGRFAHRPLRDVTGREGGPASVALARARRTG